ncbi:hypothetical protein FA95DRAFT_656717 [Auriscalpium vulgare]|uniref:Uncharacterized protein n=1 Tax=Auriscalpium vulgare TaxID=40419 RepID=A0ACB8RCX9_9AGAM|nr:hypothetical protein FA95DRAFT_656717 [Auriscalpium vulgare]
MPLMAPREPVHYRLAIVARRNSDLCEAFQRFRWPMRGARRRSTGCGRRGTHSRWFWCTGNNISRKSDIGYVNTYVAAICTKESVFDSPRYPPTAKRSD